MSCHSPNSGWKSSLTSPRKGGLTFKRSDSLGQSMQVGCGKCDFCRELRSRDLASRCVHESKIHTFNSFLTLTYDDDHLPSGGNLHYPDITYFLDRLRKRIGPIRYIYCGEYGDTTFRPHYHAIIFGHDFLDKKFFRKSGEFDTFTSVELQSLWPHGQSLLGSVTPASALYICGYLLKHPSSIPNYLVPEKAKWSTRPALGRMYLEKFESEFLRDDSFRRDGKAIKLPRYYDKRLALTNPVDFERVKSARRLRALELSDPVRDFEKSTRARIIHQSKSRGKAPRNLKFKESL